MIEFEKNYFSNETFYLFLLKKISFLKNSFLKALHYFQED